MWGALFPGAFNLSIRFNLCENCDKIEPPAYRERGPRALRRRTGCAGVPPACRIVTRHRSAGRVPSDALRGKQYLSLLKKGHVTAEAQRSQRRIPERVTHTHAAPGIHHGSFSGFSVPPASQRCVFAAKLYLQYRKDFL